MQGTSIRLRPGDLKELRSFLGAVNQLNKYIPELANVCAPFRSSLKKDVEWTWTEDHEKMFKKVNEEVKEDAELKRFKRKLPLKIICDASENGQRVVLQQCENITWKPIS